MVSGQIDAVFATLNGHDLLVLQLLACGYTRAQIARLVGRDEATIQGLIAQIVQHLGQQDWRAAVAVALQRGLIT